MAAGLKMLKPLSFKEIRELKQSLPEAISQRDRDKTFAFNVIPYLYIGNRTLD
jgi:hypothetical protein